MDLVILNRIVDLQIWWKFGFVAFGFDPCSSGEGVLFEAHDSYKDRSQQIHIGQEKATECQ